MKSIAPVAIWLLSNLAAANAARMSPEDLPRGVNLVSNQIPGAFVVELAAQNGQLGARGVEERSPHDAFYNHLTKRGVPWTVRHTYNTKGFFVGTSVQLKDARDVAELARAPGVIAVRPVVKVPPPSPVFKSVPSGSALPPDTQSSHKLITVDKLHAEGVFGKGIKVGILDTGVDYLHPNLGGGFGAGFKVAGGYDFVGDDYTGSNTPKPDADPMDCAGHGTHVSGIIAASGPNIFNISGVASEANLYLYRIFGCDGFTTDDVIIAGLLRGVDDNVDILTLSLGGVDGWTENSAAVVASRIVDSGKVITISAGNDGSYGSWYSSSPGNSIGAISVASIDNSDFPVQSLTVHGVDHPDIPYSGLEPVKIPTRPIWVLTNSTSKVDDGCSDFPTTTPDLSGFIVIIRRGTCTFVTKVTNAIKYKATAVLIYNNVAGLGSLPDLDVPAAMISADDGAFLVKQYFSGVNVTLTFPPDQQPVLFPNPTGGLVSGYSSYGPTYDMYFKPAVAAPGGLILSTVPRDQGSFAVYSGTSMSCPATAGTAALILSVRGNTKANALAVRDLLQTTANPIASSKSDGAPAASLSQQGAGLIDGYAAAHTTTIVSPGQLLLNDTAYFTPDHTFTIQNTGTAAKAYTLRHVPVAAMQSIQPNTIRAANGPVPLTNVAATVKFTSSLVTVDAGATATVTVTFTPPPGDATYPVYSGWVEIVSGSETLRVSYLGVAGTLKEKKVVDNTDFFFGEPTPAISDNGTFVPTNGSATFTFKDEDSPQLVWRLAFGTPKLNIDLVSPDLAVDIYKREVSSFWFPYASPGGSFAEVQTIGPLQQLNYLPRNSEDTDPANNGVYQVTVPNQFANGTTIPNGTYKILFRALKVTGNPALSADYETWLSPKLVFNATAAAAPSKPPTRR